MTFPLRALPALRTVFTASLLLASFGLVPARATAQHGPPATGPLPEYSLEPVGEAGAAAWREDLRALVHGLERIHPEPYGKTPEPVFDSAVAALEARIPDLAAHEIVVEFSRLLALVGDGHTTLPLYAASGVAFHVLPYRLGVYDDGLWVEAADRAYAGIVGGRVVAIDGVPAEEALHRVAPLISRDNDNWIAAVAPHLLNRMEVLHAVGLAPDLSGTTLTVRTDSGERVERVRPLQDRQPQPFGLPFYPVLSDDWVDARDAAAAPVPLYQRDFDELYGWEYLPEHDLVYIKWDQVQNRDHGPSALAVFQEALAFARENEPARTVIDIRNNTGGEGGLLPPIVREIVRSREVDQPGRLFVVIGRRTFSAGQMLTGQLQLYSRATFVGEPSSAFYNGYAGHEMVPLPRSGLTVMVSPDYYQMGAYPRDARQQATPHLAAVPTFDDYRSNSDPALEVILEYEPDRLDREVIAALEAGDSARVVAIARAHDARPVNRYRSSRSALNALGYRLLQEDRTELATAVFEANVEVHPRYANGWDSLGEAYVRADRREDAIRAFRRALEINPDLAPSREWLHRLGAEPGSG